MDYKHKKNNYTDKKSFCTMALKRNAKKLSYKKSIWSTIILAAIVICLPYLFKDLLTSSSNSTTRSVATAPSQHLPIPPLQVTPPPVEKISWLSVETRAGDTLPKLFKRQGIAKKTFSQLLNVTKHKETLQNLSPNTQIKLQLNEKKQLLQLVLPLTLTDNLIFIRENDNHFKETKESLVVKNQEHFLTAKINQSLFQTGKENHLPMSLLRQLVTIFSEKIDFNRDIRKGDRFTLIYNADYVEDKPISIGDIVAASFTQRNKTHYAIRYPNSQTNTHYFTPEGESLHLSFDRYPVQFSHVASIFNLHRYHPILHTTRAHKGIDLAAPIGSLIKAVADGYIARIGPNGGYGNMIKITHSKKYDTVYAHMLRFKKGLHRGSKVLRGQVIGYVGQTGLATGPHCHFEFHINDQSVNPRTVALPKADPLTKSRLATFKPTAKTFIAKLKLYQEANLASAAD